MTDSEREKFEDAFKDRFVLDHDNGRYLHAGPRCAWSGWQARAALDGGAVSQNTHAELLKAAKGVTTVIGGWHNLHKAIEQSEASLRQPQPDTPIGDPLEFIYTNYRGETGKRRVMPKRIWWGSTEYHPEPQWLLLAFDLDKQADRDFAVRDITWMQPDTRERDLALIDHCSNFDRDTLMHNGKYVLSDFNSRQKGK